MMSQGEAAEKVVNPYQVVVKDEAAGWLEEVKNTFKKVEVWWPMIKVIIMGVIAIMLYEYLKWKMRGLCDRRVQRQKEEKELKKKKKEEELEEMPLATPPEETD